MVRPMKWISATTARSSRDNGVASNCTIGFYKNSCSRVSWSCSSNTINLGSGGTCQVSVTGCTQIAAIEGNSSATNMMNALRAQELATKLNVCSSPALGSAFMVIANGDATGLAPGATVNQILQAADSFIAGLTNCNLSAGNVNRPKAEAFKNLFDKINNFPNAASSGTGVIINPTPCTTNCLATP